MNHPESELQAKIRQQFDVITYRRTPVEKFPKNDNELLFIHNLVKPYYLKYYLSMTQAFLLVYNINYVNKSLGNYWKYNDKESF